MRHAWTLAGHAAAVIATAFMGTGAHAESDCAALAQAQLPHAQILSAAVAKAGQREACVVNVASHPTADSDIRIEVWIPLGDAWNGKFVQAGNGGYAGAVPSQALMNLASRGFAAAGTDDGHQSEKNTSASWALGHPEKFIDFGWRALKETTDAAKALIVAHKGAKPAKSYFNGCSNGGREALMEAQRFPEDFDGIIAGAPANNMTRLLLLAVAAHQAIDQPGAHIAPAQFQAVQQAVLDKCGGETFVRDPTSCKFDVRTVACKSSRTDKCLTPPQTSALSLLYSGLQHPRTGKMIAPGFTPGGEAMSDAVNKWTFGMTPEEHSSTPADEFSVNAAKYFFMDDANFDANKFDFAKHTARAMERASPVMDSNSTDLSAFRKRGGKLIQFHGWNDQAIPAKFSTEYYDDVRHAMGEVSDFYKLYMVPGMLHCGGGAGPSSVDWLSLLADWESNQKAPEAITAVASRNAPPGAVQGQLLCPYPQIARYSQGDKSVAASYQCTAPAH